MTKWRAKVEAGRAHFRSALDAAKGMAAFDAFQERANEAFQTPEQAGFVAAAVEFFTGSAATVTRQGNGAVVIKAVGYYNAVGA